jgi:hypothetical protein
MRLTSAALPLPRIRRQSGVRWRGVADEDRVDAPAHGFGDAVRSLEFAYFPGDGQQRSRFPSAAFCVVQAADDRALCGVGDEFKSGGFAECFDRR